jgi:hypothetical protein
MLREWIAGYERAWASNDPEDIGALFAEDARYFTEPFAEPWRGRDAIVAGWLAHRDEPGDATFEWQPLVETPEASIVTGTTTYREPPRVYSNLWLIRLDADGRCREFVEWYMEQRAGS